MKNFLQIFDLSKEELLHLLERAEFFRHEKNAGKTHLQILHGKNIVMFFEKPSLRTKVSFEAAVSSFGGNAITVDGREVSGSRESIADIASENMMKKWTMPIQNWSEIISQLHIHLFDSSVNFLSTLCQVSKRATFSISVSKNISPQVSPHIKKDLPDFSFFFEEKEDILKKI